MDNKIISLNATQAYAAGLVTGNVLIFDFEPSNNIELINAQITAYFLDGVTTAKIIPPWGALIVSFPNGMLNNDPPGGDIIAGTFSEPWIGFSADNNVVPINQKVQPKQRCMLGVDIYFGAPYANPGTMWVHMLLWYRDVLTGTIEGKKIDFDNVEWLKKKPRKNVPPSFGSLE